MILFIECESGWTQHQSQFATVCYRFFSSKKTWDDAKSYCQDLAADLASVSSNETNVFLTTLTKEKCWIGGYTEDKDTWQWTDGSPWGYDNWASGMPNNRYGNQDKLQLNFGAIGEWDDLGSYEERPFICQKHSGTSWI